MCIRDRFESAQRRAELANQRFENARRLGEFASQTQNPPASTRRAAEIRPLNASAYSPYGVSTIAALASQQRNQGLAGRSFLGPISPFAEIPAALLDTYQQQNRELASRSFR